ncbi:MAG: hypothetical protein AABZ64_12455 [Nitrospinota bacterium]
MDWTSLHWPGGAPWWVLLAAAILLGESLRRRRRLLLERLPAGRANLLIALRGLLFAVILFFLSGPTLIQRSERNLPPRLLVLVDGSASMGLKDGAGGSTRLAQAAEFLLGRAAPKAPEGGSAPPQGLLDRLSRAYDVQLLAFDSASTPLSREGLRALEAKGLGSDPLRAIRAALGGPGMAAGGGGSPPPSRDERPAGILLLSDGGDTTASAWPPEDARSFPPVVSVGFGDPENFRDISLHEVRAPRIAFQDKEVHLEVTLSARGYPGLRLPVALTREGRVVRTQTVDVEGDLSTQKVEFRFTPSEVGSLLLAVETPNQRGELVESNNRVEIPLEVRRDKIRVLTISGSPSWNYNFLRAALKRDPAIDLVSFVFLRTSEDDPGVPTQELSLVPFPVDRLFLEELKNFEVVVFDNFSAQEYFGNYYLERVKDYVRKGGAFWIFGGRSSYGSGGYARSPIEELLPVQLSAGGDYAAPTRVTSQLTEAGARHPITRLSPDPDTNARMWADLPPLRRLNVTSGNEEGQVLVSSQGERSGAPLIATRRLGEGRILSVLSDDTWRWSFGMVAAARSNQLYIQLTAQMIRWLSGDPASSQVQILPDAEPGRDGLHVARVQVLDDGYQPAKGAAVRVALRDPYGNVQTLAGEFRPDTGEFEARFRPSGRGSYRAEVSAMLGPRSLGTAVRTLSVGEAAGGAEWTDAAPHWDRLQSLSSRTGGVFLQAGGGDGQELGHGVFEALHGKVPSKILEVRDVRLWSLPWVGFVLILLPAAEWTLRRLWGLA